MNIAAARMHRRATQYRAAFKGLLVFVGAFLVTFLVTSETNPVGELYAESLQLRGTVSVSSEIGFVPPENTEIYVTSDTETGMITYTAFTSFVRAEDE